MSAKYAVIATGGKQLKVSEGQYLQVELLKGNPGDTIEFDKVLLIGDETSQCLIGMPYVNNAKVSAEILSHGRDKKVRIIKMRRRKHYRRTQGHRQHFTEIKIHSIAV
jgi:large subunit ribosomal protein L21